MKVLSGKARIAGVIGWPVAHSLSPRLHGYWLNRYGIDGAYVPLSVMPKQLADALAALPKLGFAGVNVTVPHKEAALQAVTRASNHARRIGAINTIFVEPDGTLFGDSTDGAGFMDNLKGGCCDWSVTNGPGVVIGAGGAARAICVALIDGGIPQLRLINRSRSRAETLVSDIGGPIDVVSWEDRSAALEGAALLVNTTSLGMVGSSLLCLDLSPLPGRALVTDIVYNPLQTDLLTKAIRRGNPVVDGLGMLLHQARPGFAAWFGVEPEVTPELRAFVLQGLYG